MQQHGERSDRQIDKRKQTGRQTERQRDRKIGRDSPCEEVRGCEKERRQTEQGREEKRESLCKEFWQIEGIICS